MHCYSTRFEKSWKSCIKIKVFTVFQVIWKSDRIPAHHQIYKFKLVIHFNFSWDPFIPLGNILTTRTETSQNSSKWRHCFTDHKKKSLIIHQWSDLFNHSYYVQFKKSLIGNIFANIKTKILMLFSIIRSNSAQQLHSKQ